MNKKIIAIALIFVLVVTAFTACKNKPATTQIGNNDYVLYTDDDGNTVIDENNRIAVAVTDEDGYVKKDENGEPQTNWAEMGDEVKAEDYIENEVYRFENIEGWTTAIGDRLVKNETDNSCYIQFNTLKEIDEDMNLTTYLESIDSQNMQFKEALIKEGYDVTIEKTAKSIKNGSLNCEFYVYKVLDSEGKIVHYVENYYFASEKMIYNVAYVCRNGIGYDETFIFEDYLNENFTFKG